MFVLGGFRAVGVAYVAPGGEYVILLLDVLQACGAAETSHILVWQVWSWGVLGFRQKFLPVVHASIMRQKNGQRIRRRPEPGCVLEGPARMPAAWAQGTEDELGYALAGGRRRGEDLLTLARALEARLPGTRAALRDGIVTAGKAQVIVAVTALLDPGEARAAEAMVLGRAGRLTPGGLRAAIARAVIDVAPGKARKRREAAARDARVQQWAEDSGNAALTGRELPPAEVLAADQRITAWARQLKAAGLDGDMDVLRARAYLDILLGKDSRPGQDTGGEPGGKGGGGSGPARPGRTGRAAGGGPRAARCRPGSPGGSP